MNLILVYITNPTKAEANKIARVLLKKHLIACANIFPIESLYRWQGKIADESEFVLIAKTKKENYNKVKKEVEKIHSYSIPCIIQIPAQANEKYFEWLKGEVA